MRREAETRDLIEKLTAEQALKIVERLCRKEGKIREAAIAEAMNVLIEINSHDTAEEVFDVLNSIDVQDCWDRSGRSRHGYTSPDEAAVEIVEEALQPFFDQAERYHELGMPDQEAIYCMGVIFGIYRYDRETISEFRQWCEDIPGECAGFLLDRWRARNREKGGLSAMYEFIHKHCPEWAKWLENKKRR
jgi:hypothetical protein